MGWTADTLTLELTGDLHCGDLPLGFVARTFPYVPCHIPVFAMVPAAVRLLGMPDVRASYVSVEELFANNVRCTPLYVIDEKSGFPLFPWDGESMQALEYAYLSSNYGVALEPQSRSAKDGCPFEMEVLLARGRGCKKPTVLAGALFIRSGQAGGLDLSAEGTVSANGKSVKLANLLAIMQLGGDRGTLGRPAKPTLESFVGKLWGRFDLDLSDDFPSILVPSGDGRGPLPILCGDAPDVSGSRTVLTGRRHCGKGFGEAMDAAEIVFEPGWRAKNNVRAQMTRLRCAVSV